MLSCKNSVIIPVRDELHQLESYLQDALGVAVATRPWSGRDRLPHFLRDLYGFEQIDLLGVPTLLIIDANPAEQPPAVVRKHMDLLRTKQEADVIYVRTQVTAYNRKRLIEQKIPFIVPGNQMYLPMVGIDLREHFRRVRSEPSIFSPSTQVLVIHALLRGTEEVFIPSEIAKRLGYSAMTMTRAFNELEIANLVEVTVRGRERCLRFTGSRQEIWTKAQPFLRSPVTKRLFVRPHRSGAVGMRAGLTALAHYSMLASPTYTTYAFSRAQWKCLLQERKGIVVPKDPDADEIEVWGYPPAIFAEHGFVDPISLYLSLKANHDERIQASLDEMIRNLRW
jgi:DNA-binding MarR family transcriptional regulator